MSSEVVLKVEVLFISSSEMKMRTVPLMHPLSRPLGFLPSHKHNALLSLLSSLSHTSNLFLFTLHPHSGLPIFILSALLSLLYCGSRSFISLSLLSGARCPGTASIRDVVINGSMKAPPYFRPLCVPHHPPRTHCLCSCTSVRSLMVPAVAINLQR